MISNLNIYFGLFKDSFLSSIFPGNKEYFFNVMVNLGDYNKFLVSIVAILSSMLALTLVYFFGRLIRVYTMNIETNKNKQNFWIASEESFNSWGKFLVLLSPISTAGVLIAAASGRFNTDLKFFCKMVFFSKLCYYMFIICWG